MHLPLSWQIIQIIAIVRSISPGLPVFNHPQCCFAHSAYSRTLLIRGTPDDLGVSSVSYFLFIGSVLVFFRKALGLILHGPSISSSFCLFSSPLLCSSSFIPARKKNKHIPRSSFLMDIIMFYRSLKKNRRCGCTNGKPRSKPTKECTSSPWLLDCSKSQDLPAQIETFISSEVYKTLIDLFSHHFTVRSQCNFPGNPISLVARFVTNGYSSKALPARPG